MVDYLDTALSGRDWLFLFVAVVACGFLWAITSYLYDIRQLMFENRRDEVERDLIREGLLSETRDIHAIVNSIDTNVGRD